MALALKTEGEYWEQQALAFLRSQGLRLLQQNFRAKCGEIDLIMLEQETLVFVEVRKRQRSRFLHAAASIDGRKQARLWRTAQAYLLTRPDLSAKPCRFDIIAWDIDSRHPPGADWPQPRWLRSALTGF